jgi:hypothetical protein
MPKTTLYTSSIGITSNINIIVYGPDINIIKSINLLKPTMINSLLIPLIII